MHNDRIGTLRALLGVLAEADGAVAIEVKLVHHACRVKRSLVAQLLRAIDVLVCAEATAAVAPVVIVVVVGWWSMMVPVWGSMVVLQAPPHGFLKLSACSFIQALGCQLKHLVKHVPNTRFLGLTLQQLAQLIPKTIFLFVRLVVIAKHAVVLLPLFQDGLVILDKGNGAVAVRVKHIKFRFVLGLVSRVNVV